MSFEEYYTFPVWVGMDLGDDNRMMLHLFDIWDKRDGGSMERIVGEFLNLNTGKFKHGMFDVKTVHDGDGDTASSLYGWVVHTCEFNDLSVCNWNEMMVMRGEDGIHYYTPFKVKLKKVLSSAKEWEIDLLDKGFFYISGDADIDDKGKLINFKVTEFNYLCYKYRAQDGDGKWVYRNQLLMDIR